MTTDLGKKAEELLAAARKRLSVTCYSSQLAQEAAYYEAVKAALSESARPAIDLESVEHIADELSNALSLHNQARTTVKSLAGSVWDTVQSLRVLIDEAGKEKSDGK